MKTALMSLLVGLMSALVCFSAHAVDPVPGPVPLPAKQSFDINDPNHACAALVTVCKDVKGAKGKKGSKGDLVKNCVAPIAESKGASVPKGVDAKKLAGQSEATYSSCQAALKAK